MESKNEPWSIDEPFSRPLMQVTSVPDRATCACAPRRHGIICMANLAFFGLHDLTATVRQNVGALQAVFSGAEYPRSIQENPIGLTSEKWQLINALGGAKGIGRTEDMNADEMQDEGLKATRTMATQRHRDTAR